MDVVRSPSPDVAQTRQCPELKLFINNLEKVLTTEISALKLESVPQQLVRR